MPSDSSHPDQPLYPVDRTFVIQWERDATADGDACRGRIEHLTTGEVLRFSGLGEMMLFVERLLNLTQAREGSSGGPNP